MSSLWELFVQISGDSSGFNKSLKDSSDSLTGFDKLASEVGGRIAGYLSATAIAGGILKASETFETASISIQRSTGEVGDKLDSLEKSFKNLYVGSAQSGEAISAAMVAITQKTGATGDALEGLTKSALNFSKVTGVDLVASVKTNEMVFQSWGISAAGQAGKLDVLYVASQKTGIGVDQLSQAMLTMGPTLRNVGFEFNESVALIASFEKAGLDATDMTMGLNVAFAKFSAANKDPKQALLDLIDKLGGVNRATGELMVTAAGFSQRTAGKFVDAVQSGAFALKDLIEILAGSGGAVDRMSKQTDTLGGELTKLWHNIEGGIQQSSLIHWLTDVLAKMNDITAKSTSFWGALLLASANVAGGRGPLSSGMPGGQPSPPGLPAGYNDKTGLIGTLPTGVLGGNGDAGGAAAGQIPAYLNLTTMAQAMVVEKQKEANSEFQKTLTYVTDWYDGMGKVATVSSKLPFYIQDSFGAPAIADLKAPLDVDAALFDKIDKLIKQMGADSMNTVADMLANDPYGKLAESAKYFGITTAGESDQMAKKSQEMYDQMLASGKATYRDLTIAGLENYKTLTDADLENARIDKATHDARIQQADEELSKITTVTAKIVKDRYDGSKEMQAMAHQTFDSLEKGLAADIVAWKGWSTTIKDVGKTLATDFLAIMLKGLFKPLEDQFAALASKIGGILGGGSSGGGVLGTSVGAAGGAAGTIAGGTSSAAGVASSAVGSGVSGVMGIVGAVGSAVSAISGIIGNFQNAQQETTLNAIEHNTRYSMMYLGERSDGGILTAIFKMSEQVSWGPGVKATEQLRDAFIDWVGSGGKGGGATYNFDFRGANLGGATQANVTQMMTAAFRQAMAAQA